MSNERRDDRIEVLYHESARQLAEWFVDLQDENDSLRAERDAWERRYLSSAETYRDMAAFIGHVRAAARKARDSGSAGDLDDLVHAVLREEAPPAAQQDKAASADWQVITRRRERSSSVCRCGCDLIAHLACGDCKRCPEGVCDAWRPVGPEDHVCGED